jgi:predicted DNA-binding ribbon-helix-helix protein
VLKKRSFALAGHRTSLQEIAAADRATLGALVARVDAGRDPSQPLASALRVLALLKNNANQALR